MDKLYEEGVQKWKKTYLRLMNNKMVMDMLALLFNDWVGENINVQRVERG